MTTTIIFSFGLDKAKSKPHERLRETSQAEFTDHSADRTELMFAPEAVRAPGGQR